MVGYVDFDVKTAYFGDFMEYADHELIHCEDLFSLYDETLYKKSSLRKSLLKNFWLEGRAIYGTKLLTGKTPKKVKLGINKLQFPDYEIKAIAHQIRKELPFMFAFLFKLINDYNFLKKYFQKYVYYLIENIYFKFYNSLCEIEKEVGNPLIAFRITNQFPKSWKAVFKPLDYYKEEIEKFKKDINYKKHAGRTMKRFRQNYRNNNYDHYYDDYYL